MIDPFVEGARWRPVSGGDVNEAFSVELPDGRRAFVKRNRRAPDGMFAAEARGLELPAGAAGDELSVPAVLGQGDRWLALEWVELGHGGRRAAERLGRGLAALHSHSWTRFGLDYDNWIGTLPQRNGGGPFEASGAAFFAHHRLLEQVRQGSGRLPRSLRRRVERFAERCEDLLPVSEEPSALLHGDLWGGNWSAVGDQPWIYDPAVFYGCREAELAFTRLFGGFPAAFYDAYTSSWPLLPGFDERVDLWNVYPLLVHANLFGGGYAGRAEGILRRVVG